MSDKIENLGEFNLIDRIKTFLPRSNDKNIIIAIGDDTAVVKMNDHKVLLATCDIQIENQHFRLKHITPYQLGKRSVAVNLSDIASMGGTPKYALVSMGLPPSFPVQDFDQLIKGMSNEMSKFGSAIIGGNLAYNHDNLIIDITLLGEHKPANILTRSGAKHNDRICVTGQIGTSALGYYILNGQLDNVSTYNHYINKHLLPVPRIETGKLLAKSHFATSMIDLSDGLASDLFHICKSSNVGAEIYYDKLPISDKLESISMRLGLSADDLTLFFGEDYELLFTVKPDTPDQILTDISNKSKVKITEIGRIKSSQPNITLIKNGFRKSIQNKGWDHFKKTGE